MISELVERNIWPMKKVCHISSAHPRYDVRIVERECVSLTQAGYRTYFVVNDSLDNELYKGVNICSTGFVAKNRFSRILNGVRMVYREALKIDADIYHLHDPELLLIARRLKRKGKRVIFDSHEYYYEQIQNREYIPRKVRKLIAKVYYHFESSITKEIDGVIIPAKIEGKNVFEGRAKRVVFINNVPRLEEVPIDLKRNIQGEGICYAGSLSYERGVWHLMKAAQKANVTLALAGRFSPENFKDKILKVETGKFVSYRGVLNREQIYDLYCNSAIGMSTLLDIGQYSKMGNFPTKVYEYMSVGLPVILSDFPFNREMVEKYNIGLLARPDDVVVIAKKIRYLIDNKEFANKLGENGRNLVLEKLNWSVEEKKLIALYQELSLV